MAKNTFKILSLCSGVGGLELGLKLALPNARTICYVEGEAYCCEVLAKRMEEKLLDEAPIWSDVKTFDGTKWSGKVDCLVGGYPCQPFSIAGKQLGEKDPRHLWPQVARLIGEINPPICFFENVGGHLRLGFEQVANDLLSMGYKVKTGLFTAEEVGAPHQRERLFILAYNNKLRCNNGRDSIRQRGIHKNKTGSLQENQPAENTRETTYRKQKFGIRKVGQDMADIKSAGTEPHQRGLWQKHYGCCTGEELEDAQCIGYRGRNNGMAEWKSGETEIERSLSPCNKTNGFEPNKSRFANLPIWPPKPEQFREWQQIPIQLKPAILRMADGLANRLDRVRACGNGVVPLVAAHAWRTLTNGMYIEYT